jgi:hypothetical protein
MGGQMTSACCEARLDNRKQKRNRCRVQKNGVSQKMQSETDDGYGQAIAEYDI